MDYDMPAMNGIKASTLIKEKLPVKIIMLTAQASHQNAVDAFNIDAIDKFILKRSQNDSSMFAELHEAIYELQVQHFNDISRTLVTDIISINPNFPVGKESFIRIFNKFFQDMKITEFYLLSITGSFLMLDIAGNPYWLVLQENKMLDNYLDIAMDHSADENTIIAPLRNREKIPFFLLQNDFEISPSEWDNYMYPAKPLDETKEYYYSFIKGNCRNILDVGKIFSQKSFLQSL